MINHLPMLRLWNKVKDAIEENEREHQRMMDMRDPEESTIVPIYARDVLLQFDHLVVFEEILHEYLIKTSSFKNVEAQLNDIFGRDTDSILESEIRTDTIPLHYENKTLSLTKEFDTYAPPFHFFLNHHGLELEERLSAIEVIYKKNDVELKKTMLNAFSDDTVPYFIADSHPVMPSNLTMFLKYAIRHLDETKLAFYENRDEMLWERNFSTMALLFDFIRQHKDYREQLADIIVHHCSDCYRIPKDIAAALLAHATEQRSPYHSSEFKIHLNFIPQECCPATLSGSLTVFYF